MVPLICSRKRQKDGGGGESLERAGNDFSAFFRARRNCRKRGKGNPDMAYLKIRTLLRKSNCYVNE